MTESNVAEFQVTFIQLADGRGQFGPFQPLMVPPGETRVRLVLTTIGPTGDPVPGMEARFVGTQSLCSPIPPPPNSEACDPYQVPVTEIAFVSDDATRVPEPGEVAQVSVDPQGDSKSWYLTVKNDPAPARNKAVSFRLLVKSYQSVLYNSTDPTIILQPSMR